MNLCFRMKKRIVVENDQNLHNEKISFDTASGHNVTVNAIWQDNMPSGSNVGTVVAIHGSPGSHNDFKYIEHHLQGTGIRLIGLNIPGHGYTQNHKRIGFHNDDRNSYLQTMLNHLKLESNIIFIGHSRGTENALNITVFNCEKAVGMVLINPTGLRMHNGIKPFFIIKFARWFYNLGLPSRLIMHPILFHIYNRLLGLRTPSGKIAAVCVKTMETSSLGQQAQFIQRLNSQEHIKVLLAYSGKDYLIEEQISREMTGMYEGSSELIIEDSSSDDVETRAAKWTTNRLKEHRTAAVCFKQDGHFLQKYKAKFLADSIADMFGCRETEV